MKSPADTAEAHSESGDDEGPAASSDVETTTDDKTVEPDPAPADATTDDDESETDGESETGGETDGDETAGETGNDGGGTDGGDGPRGDDGLATRRRRSPSLLQWIAAVVLVAVLAFAGYAGWQLYQHHQVDVAAEQALAAADEFALTLTTINPNAIDANITEVLDGSTGEFKNLYQQSSDQLRQVLIDNEAAAQGVVIDSAVKSATKNRVEVVLFIDQVVANSTAPEPQLDRSRVVMTMEKVGDRWLAAKVDLP
ncbi:MAG: Mce protein [Actinomycetia bacterium]|nr:Mce protein [Actinomycetes bacterium]MCH9710559.1 Mce protein [Actinomycetes bacterium]MCH9767145.1 Mce protein [Actinomycetes bacterium]